MPLDNETVNFQINSVKTDAGLSNSNEELDSSVEKLEDLKSIQDHVDEYSTQVQELISASNEYYQNKTIASSQNYEASQEEIEFIESTEYDSGFEPAKNFSISLGTNDIPRFSCSNHKINIAVRMAIKKSSSFTKMLISLSRFASSIRMSTIKSREFILKKVRLQIENTTRWSSSFLMLESFYRAYKAEVFNLNPCPVTFEKIQSYLLILLPAYQLNLIMQKDKSSITDVLPSLKIMLTKWSRMILSGEYDVLRNNLIASFKYKFDYELKSKYYSVAALLNVSKLKIWYNRNDCSYIRQSANSNLIEVRDFFDKKGNVDDPKKSQGTTPNIGISSSSDSLAGFLEDDNYEENSTCKIELEKYYLNKKMLI